MSAWWPFGRRKRDTPAPSDDPRHSEHATRRAGSAAPTAAINAWRDLPPLRPSAPSIELTAPVQRLAETMTSTQHTGVTQDELGHIAGCRRTRRHRGRVAEAAWRGAPRARRAGYADLRRARARAGRRPRRRCRCAGVRRGHDVRTPACQNRSGGGDRRRRRAEHPPGGRTIPGASIQRRHVGVDVTRFDAVRRHGCGRPADARRVERSADGRRPTAPGSRTRAAGRGPGSRCRSPLPIRHRHRLSRRPASPTPSHPVPSTRRRWLPRIVDPAIGSDRRSGPTCRRASQGSPLVGTHPHRAPHRRAAAGAAGEHGADRRRSSRRRVRSLHWRATPASPGSRTTAAVAATSVAARARDGPGSRRPAGRFDRCPVERAVPGREDVDTEVAGRARRRPATRRLAAVDPAPRRARRPRQRARPAHPPTGSGGDGPGTDHDAGARPLGADRPTRRATSTGGRARRSARPSSSRCSARRSPTSRSTVTRDTGEAAPPAQRQGVHGRRRGVPPRLARLDEHGGEARTILTHELTHVAQQRRLGSVAPGRGVLGGYRARVRSAGGRPAGSSGADPARRAEPSAPPPQRLAGEAPPHVRCERRSTSTRFGRNGRRVDCRRWTSSPGAGRGHRGRHRRAVLRPRVRGHPAPTPRAGHGPTVSEPDIGYRSAERRATSAGRQRPRPADHHVDVVERGRRESDHLRRSGPARRTRPASVSTFPHPAPPGPARRPRALGPALRRPMT